MECTHYFNYPVNHLLLALFIPWMWLNVTNICKQAGVRLWLKFPSRTLNKVFNCVILDNIVEIESSIMVDH